MNHNDYEQRWACVPPPRDVTFKVLRDQWNDDYTVRTIFEWVASDNNTPVPCDVCRRDSYAAARHPNRVCLECAKGLKRRAGR